MTTQQSVKGLSVAGKIAVGAMFLVLVTVGVTGTVAVRNQTEAMVKSEQASADLLASAVAISAANDIARSDVANLNQTVRRIREANRQLMWIAIYDADGKLLAANPEESPKQTSGSAMVERHIPPRGIRFGDIKMVFDRGSIEAAKKEIIQTTFALTAGLLVIVMLGALVWAHFFARPIVSLADAADRVSSGDLNTAVDASRGDELGRLAARFNEMVVNLRKSRAELEKTLNELSTLYNVSRIVNTTTARDEILRLNIETLVTGFGFSRVVILLELDHIWRVAASHGATMEDGAAADPGGAGLDACLQEDHPVPIEADRLPATWGFLGLKRGSVHAVALKSGSHLVGILIAGRSDSEKSSEADGPILGVIASQIAPPILISLMVERESSKEADPFGEVQKTIDSLLARVRSFGVSLTLLTFDIPSSVLTSGSREVDKAIRDLSNTIRKEIPDAEALIRYGAGSIIAVVPGMSRSDARAILMNFELPGMDDLVCGCVSFPEDGATSLDLLMSLESARRA